jgi:hypothetical protein
MRNLAVCLLNSRRRVSMETNLLIATAVRLFAQGLVEPSRGFRASIAAAISFAVFRLRSHKRHLCQLQRPPHQRLHRVGM